MGCSGLSVIRAPQKNNFTTGTVCLYDDLIRLAFPGRLERLRWWLAPVCERRLHPFHSAGEIVWVLDHMREEAARLEGQTAKCAIGRWQGRPAWAAGRWDL